MSTFVGRSADGFAIRTLLLAAPWNTLASVYRTAHGAEMDLVLEIRGRARPWAVEIKFGSPPRLKRGAHTAWQGAMPDARKAEQT